jgi:MarR family 2-MHQ and catechol resistance regulon transcriptional repressor
MMSDFKEEYYFGYVPEREKDNEYIDWKAYRSILNVVLTYSAMESRMAKFLSKWDLFPSAFNLMVILARTDGHGMHLSRISELLAVSRANVTGLVDVLARKDLVERVSSPSDRRVRLALLTNKGSKLINEILPQYYQFNSGLCKDISEEDFETLIKTLTHIRKAIHRECVEDEKLVSDSV